ncbi:MAG: T9SS type A sorting domain-containing protein [Dysgonamonadaceae bacterium]|nr:T9SS type A sorting domain-containing protein [Dysgonamonadaceae bacterium]
MKYLLQSILFVGLTLFAWDAKAQTYGLDENFSDGIPSGWTTTGSVSKTTNNSKSCLSMGSNATVVTPAIKQPVTLTFSHRASGNGKTLTVEKSIDGNAWTSIGSVSPSSSSGWGSVSMNVGEMGTPNVKIRFTASSGSIFITDVKVLVSEIGDAPTVQAGIGFGTVTGSSVIVNLTKGNGEGRLLVYKKTTAVDFVPQAGNSYPDGTVLSGGNYVAQSGDLAEVTVQGLEAGETYHFAVFEYNGFDETANYLTPGATGNIRTMEIPSIRLSTYKIAFDRLKTGTEDKREFEISGKYLNPAQGSVTVTGTADFQVSTDNQNYALSATIPYNNAILASTKIYVRFAPEEIKDYAAEITVSGGDSDTQTLSATGSGSDTDTKIFYLSPNGNDNNRGSYDAPWFTLGKAIEMVNPGDIVYVRGGEYSYPGMTFRINASKSGTAGKRISIFAYNGEQPVFNFDQPTGTSEGDGRLRGIVHQGDYWYFYGIHFTKARDNGVKLEGNHNIYERCIFSYCGDTGIQLGFGHSFADSHPGISKNDGSYCSDNLIVDCDSYRNYDWQTKGGNADGFACKMHNGRNNWFVRCRAWENSDDGWDLYETDFPVYLVECWAWHSAPEGILPERQGNGNAIKLGGNGSGGSSVGVHEAWNCIAFNCNKTGSVKGFDQNSHKGGVKVVNCLAFGNGYDFMFETASSMEFYNNVCFGKQEIEGGTQSNNALGASSSKGWADAITGISASDYVDLSETAAIAPRGADGSMPTGFARLKSGSPLIGAAKPGLVPPLPDMDVPLFGSALDTRYANRDIGPYDRNPSTDIPQVLINANAGLSLNVYPNPVQTEAYIKWSVSNATAVRVDLYNLQGKQVMNIASQAASGGIEYCLPLPAGHLPSGVYLLRLTASSGEQAQAKLIKCSK